MAQAARCCDDPRTGTLVVLSRGASGHYWVGSCTSCAGALIEHYSYDDWDTGAPETYDMYWWWRMDAPDAAALREAVKGCPAPLDPGCGCRVHEGLRKTKPRPLPPPTGAPNAPAEIPRVGFAVTDARPHWTELY
ncbi:hypothetical protein [Actinomadura rubrisoli]|uniref:Uncharacterized protein n=1 Tax=Actinomadura rubrisoli TaxID=2530368 RepID=A0A4R5A049_9ACTN|nr:hypothetical protein [Actinomadura rubrisoli]TDD64066.1 hypothetical protein E1298_42745 [Actinomadura rubrisoli]